jgi:hypothetical protein
MSLPAQLPSSLKCPVGRQAERVARRQDFFATLFVPQQIVDVRIERLMEPVGLLSGHALTILPSAAGAINQAGVRRDSRGRSMGADELAAFELGLRGRQQRCLLSDRHQSFQPLGGDRFAARACSQGLKH